AARFPECAPGYTTPAARSASSAVFLFIDFLSAVLLPGKDVKTEVFQVALIIPRNFTNGGADRVGMQPVGHLGGVICARALDAFGNGLGGGKCRELERTARVTVLVGEGLHDLGVGRVLSEVGGQRNQHAVDGRAGNGVDVGVADAFGTHEFGIQTLLGRLAQQQTHFRVIAAVIHEIRAAAADLGDDGGVVAVAGVDAFEHRHLDACLFEFVAHRCGDTLAVRLFVVQYGHGLGLDGVDDELCRRRALLVVTPDGAEDHVVVLAVGNRRSRGRRRNHHHTFGLVDVGGRNGGARTHVTHHVVDAVVHNAVGDDRALLGLAAVVHDDRFELLAQHAARGVDHLDGGVDAFLDHGPVLGDGAGERAGNGDLDGFGVCAG